jgi:hypothetical protein
VLSDADVTLVVGVLACHLGTHGGAAAYLAKVRGIGNQVLLMIKESIKKRTKRIKE